MTPVQLHNERHRGALRDLADLADQVAAGEIDDATAAVLRDRYETTAVLAARRLRALEESETPAAAAGAGSDAQSADPPRRRRKAAAGVAIVGALVAAALVAGIRPRPEGGFVTGNEAVEGRDLTTVTIEEMAAVVEANPEIVPMRLRLAHRYLDDGQPSPALAEYLEVLKRVDDPEASAHAGWIVFNDGRTDLARELLDASLAARPDDPEAMWFLANVALFGEDDPEQALRLADALLARDDLGDQRGDVEELADLARQRQDEP